MLLVAYQPLLVLRADSKSLGTLCSFECFDSTGLRNWSHCIALPPPASSCDCSIPFDIPIHPACVILTALPHHVASSSHTYMVDCRLILLFASQSVYNYMV